MRKYPEYYGYRTAMKPVSKESKKLLKGKDKRFLKSMLENKMTGICFYKINKKVAENSKLGLGVYGGFSVYLSSGGDGCVGPYFEIDKTHVFKNNLNQICAISRQNDATNELEVRFFEEPIFCNMVDKFETIDAAVNNITIHFKNSNDFGKLISNFDKYHAKAMDDLHLTNIENTTYGRKICVTQREAVKEVENFETKDL